MSTDHLRSVDRELLLAMRSGESSSIGQLTEKLGVTATAVRQRVDRLMESGLIQRQKEKASSGRGRPTFSYLLTVAGHRSAGANPADFAEAMWLEILAIPDEQVRNNILAAVASRLGKQYAAQLAGEGETLEERLKQLSKVMAERQIPSEVSHEGQLPVLDISLCPYPSLTDVSDDRAMCRLEEQMISEALGAPVHLSSCRLDGDDCCQFSAVPVTTAATAGAVPASPQANDKTP